MENSHSSLNKILVKLFNDILKIEEKYLCRGDFNNLTMSEFHIIENIGLGEGKTMSETAKALKITSGTLTTGIDNLVKKGYVFRKRSTEDRRKVLIKLTEDGVQAYNAHYKFHEEMVADTLQQIPRDEEEVLIRALFNVDKYFKKKYKL